MQELFDTARELVIGVDLVRRQNRAFCSGSLHMDGRRHSVIGSHFVR